MTKKLGLALGGGAALGWSHIGVLQVLEENGIRPDIVSGTSIGSLVGACYVGGKFDELEEIARSLNRIRMVKLADVQIGKNGFLRGDLITKLLRRHLADMKIEDMERPFGTVATDLVRGRQVVSIEGSVVDAVRASISIPGVFTPIKRDGQLLVDGGLLNNVPVSVCMDLGADKVIGVNITADFEGQAAAAGILAVNEEGTEPVSEDQAQSRTKAALSSLSTSVSRYFRKGEREPTFLGMGLTSVALIMRELGAGQLSQCPADIMIEPMVGHITLIEFDRADELIALGRESTENRLEDIRELIGKSD